jgi:hypothetical protein
VHAAGVHRRKCVITVRLLRRLQVRPGLMREQRSVVHIKKCRYLESSGCVGMCVNMCKVRVSWSCRRLGNVCCVE